MELLPLSPSLKGSHDPIHHLEHPPRQQQLGPSPLQHQRFSSGRTALCLAGTCALWCAAALQSRSRRQRSLLRAFEPKKCSGLGRRDAGAAFGLAIGLASGVSPAFAARMDWLYDILPMRDIEKAVLKMDFALQDSYTTALDSVYAAKVPKPDLEVEDAPGAEDAVAAAARAAARAIGLDVDLIDARTAALLDEEPRRIRGRAEAGLFESDTLGSAIKHLATLVDSYTFRAYCRWRALNEVIGRQQDLASRFQREFGRRLLSGTLLGRVPPPPVLESSPKQVAAFEDSIRALLAACVEAGLCAGQELQIDEVLAEVWAEGTGDELELPARVEGDPLVDAQVILMEERGALVVPDPILAICSSWISEAKGPVDVTLTHYYVNSRWRRKRERQALVYVPKQRFLQFTLRR